MHKASTILKNFFFPLRCIFCSEILPLGTESDSAVCSSCKKKLPYCIDLPRCKTCGKPVEEPAKYCQTCREHPQHPFSKLCVPYLYEPPVKGSIVRFKRERYQGNAKVYARHMEATLFYEFPETDFDAIVSVPPRKKRLCSEGYDQAAQLARALAERTQLPYLAGVLRQKEDRLKQSDLRAKERWNNALGNFVVAKPALIRGKTLLLVDDVVTTGATLHSCSLALKQQGAFKIYCITAAAAK